MLAVGAGLCRSTILTSHGSVIRNFFSSGTILEKIFITNLFWIIKNQFLEDELFLKGMFLLELCFDLKAVFPFDRPFEWKINVSACS